MYLLNCRNKNQKCRKMSFCLELLLYTLFILLYDGVLFS